MGSFKYFKKAAQQNGNLEARRKAPLHLAVMYFRGEGVKVDYAKARESFDEAVLQKACGYSQWLGWVFITSLMRAARKKTDAQYIAANLFLGLICYHRKGIQTRFQGLRNALKKLQLKIPIFVLRTIACLFGRDVFMGFGVDKDSARAKAYAKLRVKNNSLLGSYICQCLFGSDVL